METIPAGELIKRARTEAGLSLRALAARAQTSHSAIAAYEAGHKSPSLATLTRILDAAGFALDATLVRVRDENDDRLITRRLALTPAQRVEANRHLQGQARLLRSAIKVARG